MVRNQPLDYHRSKAWGLAFDKLNALSSIEGLSLPAGRQGLILSGVFTPAPKAGVWRRRSIKKRQDHCPAFRYLSSVSTLKTSID